MNMYPYQTALWDKLNQGGFKQGEIMLLAAGRKNGKSMLNQMFGSMMKPVTKFEINAKAEVDGATWYTVSCTKEISEWLRTQPKELQYEALAHGWVLSQFDIHEKLYTMLALKWS
jgi:hypothetical protein